MVLLFYVVHVSTQSPGLTSSYISLSPSGVDTSSLTPPYDIVLGTIPVFRCLLLFSFDSILFPVITIFESQVTSSNSSTYSFSTSSLSKYQRPFISKWICERISSAISENFKLFVLCSLLVISSSGVVHLVVNSSAQLLALASRTTSSRRRRDTKFVI